MSRRVPWLIGLALLLGAALPAGAGAPGEADARAAHRLWKEAAGLHLEGRYEDAVSLYRRALARHPTARIHNYLAWSLSELDRYREAADHARKAIALDPSYPNAYNDLGAYLIELGRPRDAEPWLRRAMAMEGYCCPHFAHFQMGRALLLEGRVNAASKELRRALAIHPRYRPAVELLREIRRRELQGT